MSLVGPRPVLADDYRLYTSKERMRSVLKPGITGLWQISGRSDLTSDMSIRLDLYYIDNWSISGDLIILWRTLLALVRPVGAY